MRQQCRRSVKESPVESRFRGGYGWHVDFREVREVRMEDT